MSGQCPTCGGDEMAIEAAQKRGYKVTINGVYATFPCHKCGGRQEVNVNDIDTVTGVKVKCSCGAISFIPPFVWCKTCKNVLVSGWQSKVGPVRL
jgi:transcription elongation factor Elf1